MKMLKISFMGLMIAGTLGLASCNNECTVCTDCNLRDNETLCEDDYASDALYEADVDLYEADGCNCLLE